MHVDTRRLVQALDSIPAEQLDRAAGNNPYLRQAIELVHNSARLIEIGQFLTDQRCRTLLRNGIKVKELTGQEFADYLDKFRLAKKQFIVTESTLNLIEKERKVVVRTNKVKVVREVEEVDITELVHIE
jgi:hypothetical protein